MPHSDTHICEIRAWALSAFNALPLAFTCNAFVLRDNVYIYKCLQNWCHMCHMNIYLLLYCLHILFRLGKNSGSDYSNLNTDALIVYWCYSNSVILIVNVNTDIASDCFPVRHTHTLLMHAIYMARKSHESPFYMIDNVTSMQSGRCIVVRCFDVLPCIWIVSGSNMGFGTEMICFTSHMTPILMSWHRNALISSFLRRDIRGL